jgi:hypothetical protein
MSELPWHVVVRDVLVKHFEDNEAAIECVIALYSAIRATHHCLIDKVDGNIRYSVVKMLSDFALALPMNPFYIRHQAFMAPVFATAVNAWFDSGIYMEKEFELPNAQAERKMELRVRAVSSRNAIYEIALAALYCAKAGQYRREQGFALRQDLMDLEDKVV